MTVGKVIKEPFFQKILLINKINKQNKHTIIVKGKWMKDELRLVNKKLKTKYKNIKIQMFLLIKNLKI
jgi:hypothetical protein